MNPKKPYREEENEEGEGEKAEVFQAETRIILKFCAVP